MIGPDDDIRIRDAEPRDRPHLLAMIGDLNAFEGQLEADRIDSALTSATHLAEVERVIAREGGFILVAEHAIDGRILGFTAVMVLEDSPFILPRYRRYAYIGDLYVVPEARGRGVSGKFLNVIKPRVAAKGLSRIGIGSLAVNKDARNAYDKLGFRPYAVEHVLDLDDDGTE
jgi:GNAT superfamily N-acetyltransferase